jgi:hypothetical protein
MAAAFSFGREGFIPKMFINIIRNIQQRSRRDIDTVI